MSFADCLDALSEAIAAAGLLGLDAAAAGAVGETARQRLRFPGSTYVLALAGGTGVGKSTLLNAIAGSAVSRATARRPTTSEPLAWVPREARAELAPLLDWLGVREVREHADAATRGVAILDLPDLDSIAPEHRARVDGLLPRVDAVLWLADPEKYKDALLHDEYLLTWMPRLARQLVVVNKSDRVTAVDGERIRADLESRLRSAGGATAAVALASATSGEPGIAEVRRWIEDSADAKRVVAERVAAEVRVAVGELAARAGVAAGAAPLVTPARRERAARDALREALALLDSAGLERQAVAATRLAARPRGAGPLGPLTAALYRWSGRAQATAEPLAYLRRWRERGSLARVSEPVRTLVSETLTSVPPALRARVAAAADPAALATGLGAAIERAALAPRGQIPPTSWLWPLIGVGQLAVIAVLVFAALWVAVIALGGVEVASVALPALGPVPTPLLLLAAALVAGYLLARALGAHAAWLGRRWSGRLRRAVEPELASGIESAAFAALDGVDAARERLARAHLSARSCGGA